MASTKKAKLSKFAGRDVVAAKIAVTNAGDGLSAAMEVEPVELNLDDRVYLLIEADVSKITFVETKDTGDLIRVQTLKAGTATLIDSELALPMIQEQAEKNLKHAEELAGIQRIDFGTGADDSETS